MTSDEAAFRGRTVLVTGGASGIGLALCRRLVDLGAAVVMADVDGTAARQAADAITRSTTAGTGPGRGSIVSRELDVRDRQDVQAAVDEVVAEHGRLDVLVSNAGVSVGGPTEELSGADWDRVIDVNLRGVVNGVLAAYPVMVRQGQGRLVHTASGAGLAAPPFVVAYAASKHAVVGLSTSLRPEAALHGVGVTVLCPGAVDTPILDRVPPEVHPSARTRPITARQYLDLLGQRPIDPDRYARHALRAVARDRAIVVTPRRAAALWYLHRVSPSLTGRLTSNVARRVQERLVQPARPEP